jgi:SAM-dependent methyltransferase
MLRDVGGPDTFSTSYLGQGACANRSEGSCASREWRVPVAPGAPPLQSGAMTNSDAIDVDLPLSELAPHEKAKRAASFGGVASHYERFRPGPPATAVDWILPGRVDKVVDLGAGTGALTRLLVDRADDVVAVEPDARMRSVLVEQVPGGRAVDGRGESIPLEDSCVDAVLASSSWHWMDPLATLHEVGRVLRPGGLLGVMWSGPDPEGPFVAQARALLSGRRLPASPASGTTTGDGEEISGLVMGDAQRPESRLTVPAGVGFGQPEHRVFTWGVALNADELIGMLGTFSSIITLAEDTRNRVLSEARRLLRELLGVEGDVTVDVQFRCSVWRSQRAA